MTIKMTATEAKAKILALLDDVAAGQDPSERNRAEAEAHRAKAAKARRRYLEEECECPPQPVTR